MRYHEQFWGNIKILKKQFFSTKISINQIGRVWLSLKNYSNNLRIATNMKKITGPRICLRAKNIYSLRNYQDFL